MIHRINLLQTDDCIYLFFVCTDKVSGAWPENKSKCTKLFDACQSKLGLNASDPDSFNGLETPTELIAGLDTDNGNNNGGGEVESTEAQVISYLSPPHLGGKVIDSNLIEMTVFYSCTSKLKGLIAKRTKMCMSC